MREPLHSAEAKKMIAEKYLVRHFLSIPQPKEGCELDNANWLPAAGNPANGLTQVRSDMAPLLRLLESGHLRPLNGVAWKGQGTVASMGIENLNARKKVGDVNG